MKSRISARLHKETQRRKNALESLVAAGQARRLPQQRRRAHRAVHRRGRLRARHRQAGPQQRPPGAAADPRQDPQRAEGLGRRHARQRRVRGDHPGHRRRVGAHLRPRVGPLRQGHHHDRRRRRRRPHPHPAAHPVLPLHAPAGRGRPGLRRRAAAAPRRGDQPRARRPTRSSTPTPRPRCAALLAALEQAGQDATKTDPALQGPGRDGCRPARRDHHGPAATAPCAGSPLPTPSPPQASSSC